VNFFNPRVQKFLVEKSEVEKFIFEKSGVERSGVEMSVEGNLLCHIGFPLNRLMPDL
jgi:hypothetical protein